jgi:hypothetical protein
MDPISKARDQWMGVIWPMYCADCEVETRALGETYMVHHWLWFQATGQATVTTPNGNQTFRRDQMYFLCVTCLEARLGRILTSADFTNCGLNRANRFYRSDLLMERMTAPTSQDQPGRLVAGQ